MRRPRSLLMLSGASLAGLGAIYGLAIWTDAGLRLDASARRGLMYAGGFRLDRVHHEVLETVPLALALAVGLVLLALYRRRQHEALLAAVLLGAVNLVAFALKSALARLEPLGGQADRDTGIASLPSGHSAAAISVGLAAVLLCPHAYRIPVALFGTAYAAAVGVASVADGGHYPSDVASAYLLALAIAAPLAVGPRRLAGRSRSARAGRTAGRSRVSPFALTNVTLVALAAGTAYWASLAWRPEFAASAHTRTSGAVATAALVLLCAGLVFAYAAVSRPARIHSAAQRPPSA